MVSYAQNLEDVVLNRVFREVSKGFYIDVGAHHPLHDSVTKYFYDKGWRGINIEPVKKSFHLFNTFRGEDININCAVADYSGQTTFYEVPGTGLSSLLKPGVNGFYTFLGTKVKEFEVEVRTLTEILNEHQPSSIEFLKVDVEGAELQVLNGLDFNKYRPKVVLLECITPIDFKNNKVKYQGEWKELDEKMQREGYIFGLFDGLNRFYYGEEYPNIQDKLIAPANCTDIFAISPAHGLVSRMIQPNPKIPRWRKIFSPSKH
jgi:FkbM family methyltransferase